MECTRAIVNINGRKWGERGRKAHNNCARPKCAFTEPIHRARERAWIELGDMKAINKEVTSPCHPSKCLELTLSMFIFVVLALLQTLWERIRVWWRHVNMLWYGTHTFARMFHVRDKPSMVAMYCPCVCVYASCCYGPLFMLMCRLSNAKTSNDRILSISCLCMEWHYKRIIISIIGWDSKSLFDSVWIDMQISDAHNNTSKSSAAQWRDTIGWCKPLALFASLTV